MAAKQNKSKNTKKNVRIHYDMSGAGFHSPAKYGKGDRRKAQSEIAEHFSEEINKRELEKADESRGMNTRTATTRTEYPSEFELVDDVEPEYPLET